MFSTHHDDWWFTFVREFIRTREHTVSQCSTAAPHPGDSRIKLVSKKTMAADLESCVKTIDRLAQSDPAFPELTRVGGRDFAQDDAWESYKRVLLLRGRDRKATPPRGVLKQRVAT